ncbi:MAG: hypothetical protein MHM6MM_008964 [Cercozoa sp. M6MM]
MRMLRQQVEALVGPSFKLEYTDDENDVVTLGSASRDLDDALAVASVMGKMLRLTVTVPAAAPSPPVAPQPQPQPQPPVSGNNNVGGSNSDGGVAVFGWPIVRPHSDRASRPITKGQKTSRRAGVLEAPRADV